MSERKYSLAEIDRMRRAVEVILFPNGYGSGGYDFSSTDWREQENHWVRQSSIAASWTKQIEETLRTYMANGTDAEELESRAAELKAERMGKPAPLPRSLSGNR